MTVTGLELLNRDQLDAHHQAVLAEMERRQRRDDCFWEDLRGLAEDIFRNLKSDFANIRSCVLRAVEFHGTEASAHHPERRARLLKLAVDDYPRMGDPTVPGADTRLKLRGALNTLLTDDGLLHASDLGDLRDAASTIHVIVLNHIDQ